MSALRISRPSSASSVNSGMRSPVRRQERNTNFKVVIRVRPPLDRETSSHNIVAVDEMQQLITVSDNLEAVIDANGQVAANSGPYSSHSFAFDHVYDQRASQKQVFETTARPVVESSLEGYNATIFAYGQTGTGKTYTMEGRHREGGNLELRGIIPRAIEQIFSHIQRHASSRVRFLVRASYLQIYNEMISDLLKPERSNLTIREDKKRGVFVEGLSEWVVRSPAEIYGLMDRGGQVRATGETKMNEFSSRSHAVFIIIAEQSENVYVDDNGEELSAEEFQRFMHMRGVHREQEMFKLEDHVKQMFRVGKLNLVDLAGSERVRLSGATGQRLEESKQINRSLSALGNVISALTDAKGRQHIPYRDSKLTRMLEDSLGGNCKTTMMAMISPALEAMVETLSTLKFANRAKNIKNEARINEDLDQKSLLRKYERELKILRAELEERNKNVVDKRRLLELDEQRKRAEEDKMTAIRALEQRSMEFMREKEEKKKLEQRIATLMGQMIRGDRNSSETANPSSPGGQVPGEYAIQMIKEQQDKLRTDYEHRLADLERERESIEEEKAQVDRYKQLLLKQRDIMIALTQRLVERDEQIMALQDELDAYDRHHKDLEEKLDEKTALLIKFQRIAMEVNAKSGGKNDDEINTALAEWSGSLESHFVSESAIEKRKSSDSDLQRSILTDSEAVEVDSQLEGFHFAGKKPEVSKSVDSSTALATAAEKQRYLALEQQHLQVTSENNKLQQRIAQLEGKLQSHQNTSQGIDRSELEAKCALLLKEREAVCTIMEQKIKVLVHNISNAMTLLMQNSHHDPNAGNALTKDVAALQRLVNASVTALKTSNQSSVAAKETPAVMSTPVSNPAASQRSTGAGVSAPQFPRPVSVASAPQPISYPTSTPYTSGAAESSASGSSNYPYRSPLPTAASAQKNIMRNPPPPPVNTVPVHSGTSVTAKDFISGSSGSSSSSLYNSSVINESTAQLNRAAMLLRPPLQSRSNGMH